MAIELKIPEVGESVQEVQVGQWLKQEGEQVEEDENLVEIETDKATMELPAPAAGVLQRIVKKEGEAVAVGEVIGYLKEAGAPAKEEPEEGKEQVAAKDVAAKDVAAEDVAAEEKEAKAAEQAAEERAATGQEKSGHEKSEREKSEGEKSEREKAEREKREKKKRPEEPRRIMPAARRALEHYGVAPEEVEATGPGGRLLKADVERHVRQRKQQEPGRAAPRADQDGAERAAGQAQAAGAPKAEPELERVAPMSLIRRRIARSLVEAQQQAALLTTFNEIDMSDVMALRRKYRDAFQKRYGLKLGMMAFFVKAVIAALQEFQGLNAEIRDQNIVYRDYYHVGIAIGGGKALVVPVLRHAERMSFIEIERAIDDFATRARENKLRPEELAGGTFTITNGGIYGSLLSTPIINPPQSGVLGMHVIQDRPVAREGQVVIRPMMYIALTYDHRIVDGREAVSCLRRVKETLEDPARLLIEI